MISEIGGQIGWLALEMHLRLKKPVYFDDTIVCHFTITYIGDGGRAQAEVQDISEVFLRRQRLSFEMENLEKVLYALDPSGLSDSRVVKVEFLQHRNCRFYECRDPDGIRPKWVEVCNDEQEA